MKKTIEQFIKEHVHINYCEALIDTTGMIWYATPSHFEALIQESGQTREWIDQEMPITASPLDWLVDYTRCVVVYTDFYKMPGAYTQAQQEAVIKLIFNGLTKR